MTQILKIGTVAVDNSAFGRVQVRVPGDSKQPWIHFKSQEEFNQFAATWRGLQAPFLMEFDEETRTWSAHNHFRAMDERQFLGRIKGLGQIPDDVRNKIACMLLGHSPVTFVDEDDTIRCSRCGAEVDGFEDSRFSDPGEVASLHWADRLFVAEVPDAQ